MEGQGICRIKAKGFLKSIRCVNGMTVMQPGVFPEGELALIYLVVFIILFFTGPGRYSLDYLIDTKFTKEKMKTT